MKKLTKLEFKWICYDIGNSAFILLVSTILPIYFNSLSDAAGVAESDYLSYWSYATSISTIIVALLGPILGTIADYRGNKRKYFYQAPCLVPLRWPALRSHLTGSAFWSFIFVRRSAIRFLLCSTIPCSWM